MLVKKITLARHIFSIEFSWPKEAISQLPTMQIPMNSLMPFEIQYYRIRTARTYKERLAHKFVIEITFAETIALPDGSIYGPRRTRMWELRSQRNRLIFHPFLAAIVCARRTCFCNRDAPDRPSAAPSATCTFCRREVHASILSQKIH